MPKTVESTGKKVKESMPVKEYMRCRVCNSHLDSILDLGNQHITGWVNPGDEPTSMCPLELMICTSDFCRLVQLRFSSNKDLLFRNYFYESGINMTMMRALNDVANKAMWYAPLKSGDIVVDIGCNDGTLLRAYPFYLTRVGFDPAINLREKASHNGNVIVSDFFSYDKYPYDEKAKIITAVAMFYDLDDPHSFLRDVEKCLDDNGIFVVQLSYLPLMMFQNAFDNICHEHVTYYSLRSFEYLLEKHNLTAYDAELNSVNGGSIRLYIRKGLVTPSPMVTALREWEREADLKTFIPYRQFASQARSIRDILCDKLDSLLSQGKTIYGYAASTKGNVLLQYCGFTPKQISAIADRNPRKHGKVCCGSGIPIISEEEARQDNPDYFLVLAWAFMDEFMKRESNWYNERGGRFIVPLPRVTVV